MFKEHSVENNLAKKLPNRFGKLQIFFLEGVASKLKDLLIFGSQLGTAKPFSLVNNHSVSR